jgi:uncharacterized protein CbrC (UPF0167 family)
VPVLHQDREVHRRRVRGRTPAVPGKRQTEHLHFFKDAEVKIGNAREEDFNSLWAFQKKLDQLGHFRTKYTSIEDLKLKFRDQLDKLGW